MPSNEKMDKKAAYDPEDLIFAIDIGTRTIVGIVGIKENDKFKVIAAEVLEHKERSMLDGQVHDISKVAEETRELKGKIEQKLGLTLGKVAIAAAGRALRTSNVIVEREIEHGKEISSEVVSSLEMEGIQQAQAKLDSDISGEDKTQFYCVGYSVIHYYLDGYVMSSLQGHKGSKISIEILATFLPHIVVDSLYTVMNRVGLEVISLTLEPIAAINVTIPDNLRLLNLALVDIGAGTSDIAITREGSVVAYGMVPVAGDEITETIAQHYLVDFNTAEKIKIALSSKAESVSFKDILGKKLTVRTVEVQEIIRASVEHLAATISQRIMEFNQKAPSAVFLIGGGSQVPELSKLISNNLGLPEDRVAVRGREIIQNIKFSGKKLSGPEAITPFGIAITAQLQRGQDFLSVTINGKKVRLFNSRRLSVADALILIGFNPRQLIGSTGKGVTFEMNGQKKIVRGEYGKAAEIYVNEKPANLETVLNVGDDIRVTPAEDGKNAEVRIGNFIREINPLKVYYNSDIIYAGTRVLVNGQEVNQDREIKNGDRVEITEIKTLQDLIRVYDIREDKYDILVNGQEEYDDYKLKNMDMVDLRLKEEVSPSYVSADYVPTDSKAVNEKNDEQKLPEESSAASVDRIDMKAFGIYVNVNGKTVLLKDNKKPHIFVDVFNYIDFDITNPQGNIVLKLNGSTAGFTDAIKPGDVIEIYWDKGI